MDVAWEQEQCGGGERLGPNWMSRSDLEADQGLQHRLEAGAHTVQVGKRFAVEVQVSIARDAS